MIHAMKKIILPILLVFSLIAVSCESKLEIPQKGTVSTLEFYASDADAEAALNNIYASFISIASANGINNPELMILNYSSDDILAAGGNIDDHDDFRHVTQLGEHLQLDVRLEARQDTACVEVVEQLPAKFQIKFVTEFRDTFLDVFRLDFQVFLAIEPVFHKTKFLSIRDAKIRKKAANC